MKHKLLLICFLFTAQLIFSQSIIFRSGLQQEIYDIPLNNYVSHYKTFTKPPFDILVSFSITERIDFLTGIKYIPYDSRIKIRPPESEFFSGYIIMLHGSTGIPLLITTSLPLKNDKLDFYLSTGLVPVYMTYGPFNSQIKFANGNYELTETHFHPKDRFNVLINSGIGLRYKLKHFSVGIVGEYYAGINRIYSSVIVMEHANPFEQTYDYQLSGKGDYWGLNLEFIYTLIKKK
jgi:hypothetical protein